MAIYAAVTNQIITQIEQNIFDEDFIDVISRLFSEMRLMTEGAIIVYSLQKKPYIEDTCHGGSEKMPQAQKM